ncbi:HEAT repeat domain-containing protein [Mucisphaera calidilacus]|uniref:HEAT repeat protein n=1 Tax=Mucisphaera calidilacus TaxID=2527982 RepID=A0A518BW04_9BACT|nr:HEAT repeat domain-containing protein [Mucisphaera calidilacus]QDU71147.1 hypothetical protein Pan265_09960 [Mucisphaera calidilacus]
MAISLSTRRQRLSAIRKASNRLALSSLITAIDLADDAERAELVDLALVRPQKSTLLGLIRRFDQLAPSQADRLCTLLDERPALLREALRANVSQLRAGSLRVLDRMNDPRLLDLLRSPLNDDRPAIREEAQRLLRNWVRLACAPDADQERSAETARTVGSMFAALPQASHGPLAWALAVAGPRLGREVRQQIQRAPRLRVMVLRDLLAESGDELVRDRLDWWVGIPEVAPGATQGLRSAMGQTIAFRHGECLVPRQTRRGTISSKASLEEVARRFGPGVMSSVASDPGRRPEERVGLLADLITHGSTPLRSLALRHLIELSAICPAAERVIERLLHSDNAQLARSAMVWLMNHARDPKAVSRALSSPHAEVRSMAGTRMAPGLFERLVTQWNRLSTEERRSRGGTLRRIDDQLEQRVDGLLRRSPQSRRLLAVSMIRVLGMTAEFEPRLRALAASTDEKLASAAVSALGDLKTTTSRKAVAGALAHKDGRVRANAIEALGTPKTRPHTETILKLTAEGHNRVRANAIASLMGTRHEVRALDRLRTMLSDTREKHRMSAIWVARTHHIESLAPRLVEMASGDPSVAIRKRAHDAIGDVIARIEKQTTDTAKLMGAA